MKKLSEGSNERCEDALDEGGEERVEAGVGEAHVEVVGHVGGKPAHEHVGRPVS